MILRLWPLHTSTKREFARDPMRFALRWERELHNEDQAPLRTGSTPSNPSHRTDLSRPPLLHHHGQRWTNQTRRTFLKDSLRSTL